MKKILALLIALTLAFSVLALAACAAEPCAHRDADDDGACDICGEEYTDGTDVEPPHTHSYTVKRVTDDYLATAADAENAATYYYSCSCGEAGSETFEFGEIDCAHVDANDDGFCDNCGKVFEDGDDRYAEAMILAAVSKMFAVGEPQKSTSTTVQDSGDTVLTSNFVLTVGYVDGKPAAILETNEMRMRTVEDSGDSKVVLDPVEEIVEIKEYIEGVGVRTNGGRWRAGESFIPERGIISMNLDIELINEVEFEDNVLIFTIDAENAADVFEVEGVVEGDVSVTITTDGVRVTAISIEYTVAADEDVFLDETDISIDVVYDYSYQDITIE